MEPATVRPDRTNVPGHLLETLAHRCLATFRDADASRRRRETHRFQEVLLVHLDGRSMESLGALPCEDLAVIAELVGRVRAMVLASVLDEPSGENVAQTVVALTHLYVRTTAVTAPGADE